MGYHCRTLTLRTDCDDAKDKPRLKNYVKLLPNLREIQINVVYPNLPVSEKSRNRKEETAPHRPSAASRSGRTSRRRTGKSSLQEVSVALYRSSESKGIKYESGPNAWVQKFQSSEQLAELQSKPLKRYHFELPLGNNDEDEQYWNTFLRRLSLACSIPAKEVSICFKYTFHAEIERFLVSLTQCGYA
jgi:hypothetical protein